MGDIRKLELTLQDMAYGGEAVGRADNQVVFAGFGLPGERVEVEVDSQKKSFLRGRVVRVIEASPDRVEPRCKYLGQCGGCQWQYIDYRKQLDLKRKIVADQLRKVGGLKEVEVRETLGSPSPWSYRNNARFSVDRRAGKVGFTGARSHRVQGIDHCHLLHPAINEVLALIRQGLPKSAPGLPDQITVRHGVRTGQTLIAPKLDPAAFPLESGQEYLEEKLLDRTFRIAATAFFQVNTLQAEVMARVIEEELDPGTGDTVVDAYCGVGTFGLLLADRVRKVIGIEEWAPAVENAAYNARGDRNVELLKGPTERLLPRIAVPGALVVLDPPRQGCHPRVIEALAAMRPRRMAYASCDPATLARDLGLLTNRGFNLRHVQPIDMFPQTYHIESVAVLEYASAS